MTVIWQRWIGTFVLSGCCLVAANMARAQDAKTEEKSDENPLEKKARKVLQDGSPAELKALVQEIHKHLKDKAGKIGVPEARLAYGVASALEQTDRRELAAEAFNTFGTDLTASDNKQIAGFSKVFLGVARRLGAVGKELDIKGKTLDGKQVDLAKLKGKVVLVDFWATWCGPCRAEIPNIRKMYDKYNKKGFEVIGVSLDEDKDKLDEFLKEEKLPWPSIHDQAAAEGDRLAELYGVMSIPQALLVDQQGKVVALEARGPELGRLLARLIDKEAEK